jgi:hypothetical protein
MGQRPLSKDDLPAVGVSRLRAFGVIRPDMDNVTLAIGDTSRNVGLQHIHFPNGGGWSFFVCPQCQHRTRTLRLTQDNRLVCWRCDGLLYACQHHDQSLRIARLKALLYGGPAKFKPRRPGLRITNDNRPRLEASLRRALIAERRKRLQ